MVIGIGSMVCGVKTADLSIDFCVFLRAFPQDLGLKTISCVAQNGRAHSLGGRASWRATLDRRLGGNLALPSVSLQNGRAVKSHTTFFSARAPLTPAAIVSPQNGRAAISRV